MEIIAKCKRNVKTEIKTAAEDFETRIIKLHDAAVGNEKTVLSAVQASLQAPRSAVSTPRKVLKKVDETVDLINEMTIQSAKKKKPVAKAKTRSKCMYQTTHDMPRKTCERCI
jgi:hypothetical protein